MTSAFILFAQARPFVPLKGSGLVSRAVWHAEPLGKSFDTLMSWRKSPSVALSASGGLPVYPYHTQRARRLDFMTKQLVSDEHGIRLDAYVLVAS